MACRALVDGRIFYENHDEFIKMISQYTGPNSKRYWLPFTDIEEEGKFKHRDTGVLFNNSLFMENQPNGDRRQNYLSWEIEEGANDVMNYYAYNSVCQPSKEPRNIRIRGLCPTSIVPHLFRPFMDADDSLVIWIGLDFYKSIIQYNKETKMVQLKTFNSRVEAEINIKDPSQLVGKHMWTIFNDVGCTKEPSYQTNLSFRYSRITPNFVNHI